MKYTNLSELNFIPFNVKLQFNIYHNLMKNNNGSKIMDPWKMALCDGVLNYTM